MQTQLHVAFDVKKCVSYGYYGVGSNLTWKFGREKCQSYQIVLLA